MPITCGIHLQGSTATVKAKAYSDPSCLGAYVTISPKPTDKWEGEVTIHGTLEQLIEIGDQITAQVQELMDQQTRTTPPETNQP